MVLPSPKKIDVPRFSGQLVYRGLSAFNNHGSIHRRLQCIYNIAALCRVQCVHWPSSPKNNFRMIFSLQLATSLGKAHNLFDCFLFDAKLEK